jgi:hypothetical protein
VKDGDRGGFIDHTGKIEGVYMKNVFVSHIALDADFAVALKKWIELAFKKKCDVFVSDSFKSIGPGAQWISKLRKALTGSDLLVVICTKKSVNSRWVFFETGSIWARNVPMLPIRCDVLVDLPVPLSGAQFLQFPDSQFSKTLIESLETTLGLSADPRLSYKKMGNALQRAYSSVKLDGDVIDRIKHIKTKKGISVAECSAAKLAAHFKEGIGEMEKRAASLTKKGYLKQVNNILLDNYYSLTARAQRLLL